MQKINYFIVLMVFIFGLGCSGEKDTSKVPDSKESKDIMASLPEGPLTLPADSDAEANTHNDEGISHYKEGHFDIALKHFRKAGETQTEIGEIHFNEALALDKLGDHVGASEHFKMAKANASGNTLILESKILLAHIQ
jgi:tetratricopeptide (TPR) repeat protein